MVIKGGARSGAANLAAHLQRLDTNERAELRELRGVAAKDLDSALLEMEAVSLGTRTRRHFYHASINTRANEVMTWEQWATTVERLEKELSLTGQPRAVMFHIKEGRAHLHVVWSRIDLDSMTAISDSHNYRRHEIVARELEREFGPARVQGAHVEREGERPTRTPSHSDRQQADRIGLTVEQAKAQITGIWNCTDSGKAFAVAAEVEGWLLARGDRRDFVILDAEGEVRSLARLIDGAKAKDVRARMADLDPASLPSVSEARELQRARRQAQTEVHGASPTEPTTPPISPIQVTAEESSTETGQRMSDETGEAERTLAKAIQEWNEQQRAQPVTSIGSEQRAIEELAAEQVARETAYLREMERQDVARQEFIAEQQRQAELARLADEERRKADEPNTDAAILADGEITDAKARYGQALGQHYDILRPYRSLAQAAFEEYRQLTAEQAALARAAALEKDPDTRRLIELRKAIEGNEYMALTSTRLAKISEMITGKTNRADYTRIDIQDHEARGLTQGERDLKAAKYYQDRARELRDERARLQALIAERERQDPKRDQVERPPATQHGPKQETRKADQSARDAAAEKKMQQADDHQRQTVRLANHDAAQAQSAKTPTHVSAAGAVAQQEAAKRREMERLRAEREEKLRQQRDRLKERGWRGR